MKIFALSFVILLSSCAANKVKLDEPVDKVSKDWFGNISKGEHLYSRDQWDGYGYVDDDLFEVNEEAQKKFLEYNKEASESLNYLWYGFAAAAVYLFTTNNDTQNRKETYLGIFGIGLGTYLYKSHKADAKLDEAIDIFNKSKEKTALDNAPGIFVNLDF